MEKIEAVIDRSGLESLEALLVQAEIDGRPTLADVSIVESRSRF
jgi:hypothetical protein